jgi:hypothetical protein
MCYQDWEILIFSFKVFTFFCLNYFTKKKLLKLKSYKLNKRMTEIRKHCFEKIKSIFDEKDWEIVDKETLLSKLECCIFDVDLDERLRIYKITSPLWKVELLKMPEVMEKNIYNVHSYDIGREYIKFIDNIDLDPFLEQIFYLKIMEEHCQTKKYKFFYIPIDYNHNVLFEKLHNTKNLMKFTKSIFPNFIDNPNMKSLICEHPNELGYEYISNQIFTWIELNEPNLISKTTPNTFESTWDGYPIFNHLEKIKSPI